MSRPEAKFQKNFIDALKGLGFKCIRVKASGNVNKGYPDYAVFYRFFWGWLEFKKSKDAEVQPGQRENINWAKTNCFGAFVYPEIGQNMIDMFTDIKLREDKRHEDDYHLWMR